MSQVKRRLDFGFTQCSFNYIPDLVPLDSPPQVLCVKPKDILPLGKHKRFTAKQVELLTAAFEFDDYPGCHRYEALALSLGVQVKRIQNWFNNARAKRRRLIQLQKIAYTEQEIQRWRRRMFLRRSLNGTPAMKTNPVKTDSINSFHEMDPLTLPKDMVVPEQIFAQDNHVTQAVQPDVPRKNLHANQPFKPCLQTPNYVQVTPVPRILIRWGCNASIQDFPPNLFEETAVSCQPPTAFNTQALFGTALKCLCTPSDIFNSMTKDMRLI